MPQIDQQPIPLDRFRTAGQTKGQEPIEQLSSVFLRGACNIDCALFDPSSGVYGGTWFVDLMVNGTVDHQGFVIDFGQLKSMTRSLLKQTIDHALVIPVGSSAIRYIEEGASEHWVFSTAHTRWHYTCPKGSVYPVRTVALKPTVLEQELTRLLRHRLPDSIQSIQVKLREESVNPTEATYGYTHGIAHHQGLCQRLFHGHRSRVQVFVGNERRPDHEHYVAREMFGNHTHVTCASQVLSGTYLPGQRGTKGETITIGYQGSQGSYQATLPSERVLVVEQETSIECITRQIAKVIRERESSSKLVKVLSYEGVNKGAMVEL